MRRNVIHLGEKSNGAIWKDDEVREVWRLIQTGIAWPADSWIPKHLWYEVKEGRFWNHISGLPKKHHSPRRLKMNGLPIKSAEGPNSLHRNN